MPNFDKTGPTGEGPKTGAQEGDCKGAKPGQRPFDGRGRGMGRGGRGKGRGFFGRLACRFGRRQSK